MLKVYEEFNIMIQNELFKDIAKNVNKVIRKKDKNSVVLDSYEIEWIFKLVGYSKEIVHYILFYIIISIM